MKRVLNSREMYHCDKSTATDYHVSSEVLMERAALSVVSVLEEEGLSDKKILVLCGMGNNGGDGIAVARILKERDKDAVIFIPGGEKSLKAEPAGQMKSAKAYGVDILSEMPDMGDYQVIIDALFGIGLSRDIEGIEKEVIEKANEAKAARVSIDIPSGLSADKGTVLGTCFKADITVTFAFPKVGQLLSTGRKYCGRLFIKDIGITEKSLSSSTEGFFAFEKNDLKLIPVREADSHKGSYGKVLVIAGSKGMAGSAYLAAASAYKCGAGLVKIYTPEENREILQTLLPEAILSIYDKKWDEKTLVSDMKWATCILCGPGIGVSPAARSMVEFVLKNAAVPVIFDADALNNLAENPEILMRPHTDIVITPHLMEMSRLTGESIGYIKSQIISSAKEFAMNNQVICVLKDSVTVTAVPFENTYINTSGNNGMATAGSGDVLSGIITALIATGLKPSLAAPFGVYIHGLSGDMARERINAYSMTSGDILDAISGVFSEALPFCGEM